MRRRDKPIHLVVACELGRKNARDGLRRYVFFRLQAWSAAMPHAEKTLPQLRRDELLMSVLRTAAGYLVYRSVCSVVAALAVLAVASCRDVPTQPRTPNGSQASFAQSPQDLKVTPAVDTIFVGQSLDLAVTNSNGTAINKQAVWTSSDTAIAKIVSTGFASGRVTGRRTGAVTITAAAGQKTGTNATTVVLVPVRSVTVSPDSSSIQLTDSVQYTATPRDSAGNPLSDRVVAWSVADTAVARISSTGLAHARARGYTRVVATVNGVAGYANLLQVRVPELSVSSIATQDSANTGDTLSITYVVRNSGDVILPDSAVVRIGIRNAFGGIVTALRRTVPRLGIIGPYADAVRMVVPYGLAGGTYSVVAYVDCRDNPALSNDAILSGCLAGPATAGMIPEANENDNSLAANFSVRGPDFVGVSVVAPDSIFTRTEASVKFEIKNSGSAATAEFNVITGLFDATSGTYPVAIAANLGGLGSRETRLIPLLFGVPANLDPAHTYQLVAYVDCSSAGGTAAARLAACFANSASAGVVSESNENNNSVKRVVAVASNIVRVDAQPDSTLFTAIGDTLSLRATAYDRVNAPVFGVSFTYASLNPSIVSVTGPVMRARFNGNARIVVSADGRADTARASVAQRVARVRTFPDSLALRAIGDTSGFAAQAYDRNDNNIFGALITWASLDPGIVQISSPGKVVATGLGRARIVATSDVYSDTAIVNVGVTTSRVVLSPDGLGFQAIGDTARFVATAYDGNNSVIAGAAVAWTVSDPVVAGVSTSGLVTARASGTTQVIATSGGRADTAWVTVYPQVARVVASPDTMLVEALSPAGQSGLRFSAVSYDRNGNVVAGASVTWEALEPEIATITEQGGVVALANGQARMRAASNSGVADTVTVIVRQRAAYIQIAPETTFVAQGGTASVSPILRDSLGSLITESRIVTWTSLDPTIAAVYGTSIGQVIPASAGTARIVATIEGRADTALVIVTGANDAIQSAGGASSRWSSARGLRLPPGAIRREQLEYAWLFRR